MGLFHIVRSAVVSAVLILPFFALSAQVLPIGVVQGIGEQSEYQGKVVTVAGVVTASFMNPEQLEGFFMQDGGDGDPLTSDGAFVFCPACSTVEAGDSVKISGTVEEFFDLTEITNIASLEILAKNRKLPKAQLLFSNQDLERYESMRVQLPSPVMVTDHSELGTFGQVSLSPIDQVQPTDLIDPNDADPQGTTWQGSSNKWAIDSIQDLLESQLYTLDDASDATSPDLSTLSSTITDLRLGSKIDTLKGVLHYSFNKWQLVSAEAWKDFSLPDRLTAPLFKSDLRIVTFNVRNHFNGNGLGAGFLTNRGPRNRAEYLLQKTKIAAAIDAMAPTICGLQEVENDGFGASSTIQDLLAELNGMGTIQYEAIPYSNPFTDAIQNVIFYDPSKVIPQSSPQLIGNRILLQNFLHITSNQLITTVFIHLKSKSCQDAQGLNSDQDDGQGCYNQLRTEQIANIVDQFAGNGLNSTLVLGDFNAYAQEDPLDLLRSRGW